MAAIDAARAVVRSRVWALAGESAPDRTASADDPLIIDVDATLVTAHSDKEGAAATFKRGWGFHPLWTFVDHGAEGTGEPLSMLLRTGNAGSNTAADHITVVKAALAQLPGHRPGVRPGRKVLVRADTAGCTHDFLDWVTRQRLSYSVGFCLPDDFATTLDRIPAEAWTPAVDADGEPRDAAWVGRGHRAAQPGRLARADAGDHPCRTPTPRRPATHHRHRWQPDHRLRHQHPSWSARPPGTAAPPPRPR